MVVLKTWKPLCQCIVFLLNYILWNRWMFRCCPTLYCWWTFTHHLIISELLEFTLSTSMKLHLLIVLMKDNCGLFQTVLIFYFKCKCTYSLLCHLRVLKAFSRKVVVIIQDVMYYWVICLYPVALYSMLLNQEYPDFYLLEVLEKSIC